MMEFDRVIFMDNYFICDYWVRVLLMIEFERGIFMDNYFICEYRVRVRVRARVRVCI